MKGEKDQELTTLAVYRRVYLEREEDRQVAKIMNSGIDTHILRIGSLTFAAVGQLFPHQFHNFHNQDYIYPIGYKIIRYYWSLTEVNKRAPYTCAIAGEFSKISHLIKKFHSEVSWVRPEYFVISYLLFRPAFFWQIFLEKKKATRCLQKIKANGKKLVQR